MVNEAESDADRFSNVAYDAILVNISEVSHRNSAFATVDIQLAHLPVHDMLKLKLVTGTERNILPLRTYRHVFPQNLNVSGYPQSGKVNQRPNVRLTAYNRSDIKQHGALSLQC